MTLSLGFLVDTLVAPGAGGMLSGVPIKRVVVDSRECEPGSVFFAFQGEHTHGNEYVEAAFDKGAIAAVVERGRPWSAGTKAQVADGIGPATRAPIVVPVDSTLWSLQRLASAWRATLATTVIGVTGSIGKTMTRDVVASVLGVRYRVHRSERNYNNEIGLPLSLLGLDDHHEYAVLEMGMYALGEIAALCDIARPNVGIVTNVGPTHLERLGSIANIAQAKAELVAALPPDGLAILNGDDEHVRAMERRAACRSITYGSGPNNDVRAVDVMDSRLDGQEFAVEAWGERVRFAFPLPGVACRYAALAAIALGRACGLAWEELQTGLSRCGACSRFKVIECGDVTVLDDSYNAAPASMTGALDLLRRCDKRRIAVLGDMLELGSYAEMGHRQVGRAAAESCALLLAVGPQTNWLAEEAISAGMPARSVLRVASPAEAISVLGSILRPGDCVLVKGSRAMHMETIVEALVQLCGRKDEVGAPGHSGVESN